MPHTASESRLARTDGADEPFALGAVYTVVHDRLATAPSLASKPGYPDLTLGTHVVVLAVTESVSTALNTRTGRTFLLLREGWIARHFRAIGSVLPQNDAEGGGNG